MSALAKLDGTHLRQRPETCDPTLPADRYLVLWDVLVHEAPHAHSLGALHWQADGRALAAIDAALALEEPRIEAAQICRRPTERSWLRAAASSLVLADFFTPTRTSTPATLARRRSDPCIGYACYQRRSTTRSRSGRD